MKLGVATILSVSAFYAGCCAGYRVRTAPPPEIRPEDMTVIEVFACPKHEITDGQAPVDEHRRDSDPFP